jgi:ketol-acid reductoisomerase
MAENKKIDVVSALVKKLEEKPESLEHLLNIIDKLGIIDEFSAILTFQKEAATDLMVERIADTVGKLAELSNILTDENVVGLIKKTQQISVSLDSSLSIIDKLEKGGIFKSLKDIIDFGAEFSKNISDLIIWLKEMQKLLKNLQIAQIFQAFKKGN